MAPLAGLLLVGCLSSGVSLSPPSYIHAAENEIPTGAYGSAKLNAMRIGMTRLEPDADWQALHDFDVIPRRIFRRQ